MRLRPVAAMVRKDLLIFFGDRRSVILSFVVPIAIASFFGSIFKSSGSGDRARIDVAVVDQDNSTVSKSIVAGAMADSSLRVSTLSEAGAREAVRTGKTSVAVIVPPGFGDASGKAFLGIGTKPSLGFLYDPSHSTELAMIRGILTQHVIESVAKVMLGGAQGRSLIDQTLPQIEAANPGADQAALLKMLRSVQGFYNQQAASPTGTSAPTGLTMPYAVREEAVTSGSNVKYNGYAHSFAGMAVQFLLFAMANLGIEMLLDRQRGLWKRLRSAPVSRLSLLGGKVLSGTILSLMTLWVSFAFAMIVFGVRIQGSVIGFVGVSVACALMAASFGLLVAALGNTPAAARAVTTLAVLLMVMLGGAWIPAFIFPAWLQRSCCSDLRRCSVGLQPAASAGRSRKPASGVSSQHSRAADSAGAAATAPRC
jgi:ABC-2 type transport system permease protein